ncbi:MAG TPA: hypothetical protein PLG52_03350, partial [Anaerolineales bacterium]|nr:hypothetical protein [Anaerolineales bacterium]
MNTFLKSRIWTIFLLVSLLIVACGGSATEAPVATEAPATEAAPAGPTYTIIGAVNRDATQAAQAPFVTVDAQKNLLVVWAENSSGGVRQIFASQLNGTAFQPLGSSINIHTNVLADSPSITVAGE